MNVGSKVQVKAIGIISWVLSVKGDKFFLPYILDGFNADELELIEE